MSRALCRQILNSLRAPRSVAISGMIVSLLYVASPMLVRLSIPAEAKDAGYWRADPVDRNWIGAALNPVPFAGIAFQWFIATLRNRFGLREDRFFATVVLGSGLLFIAMLIAAVSVAVGLLVTIADNPVQSETYQVGRGMAYALMNRFGIRMATVFMFVTSTIGLRTAVLARWVSFVGSACGLVLLLVITAFGWIAILFPLWGLMVSAYILFSDFQQDHPMAVITELSPSGDRANGDRRD